MKRHNVCYYSVYIYLKFLWSLLIVFIICVVFDLSLFNIAYVYTVYTCL